MSHDRDFLDGLVDKMYEFRDGKVREHLGSVTEFLQKRKMETLQELERRFPKGESTKAADPVKTAAKQDFQVRKTESKEARKLRNRIAFLEDEIAKREKEMAAIEKILSAPTEKDDVMELTRDYLEKKRDLDARTAEWEKIMEETL